MSTVLVTRPGIDGEQLCERLAEAGHQAIFYPTLSLRAIDTPETIAILNDLTPYAWTIFTSPSCARFCKLLVPHLADTWPSKNNIAAIGTATAQSLSASGFSVALIPEEKFNSESLLSLELLTEVKGKKILIIKGVSGRTLISETLSSRGAKVTELNIYERACPDALPLPVPWSEINYIVATSSEALQNLQQMQGAAQKEMARTPLLMSSQRLVKAARELGFNGPVTLASNPTADALIEALSQE